MYKLQQLVIDGRNVVNVIQDGMLLASFERNDELNLMIDIDSEFAQEIDLNALFKQVNELI